MYNDRFMWVENSLLFLFTARRIQTKTKCSPLYLLLFIAMPNDLSFTYKNVRLSDSLRLNSF